MNDLITRIEASPTPDRALADEVLRECGWKRGMSWRAPSGTCYRRGHQPNPLSDLDAAWALLPVTRYDVTLVGSNGWFRATVYTTGAVEGRGPTPAAALTAAALRLRGK